MAPEGMRFANSAQFKRLTIFRSGTRPQCERTFGERGGRDAHEGMSMEVPFGPREGRRGAGVVIKNRMNTRNM